MDPTPGDEEATVPKSETWQVFRSFLFICQLLVIESLSIIVYSWSETINEDINHTYSMIRSLSTIFMLFGLIYSVLRIIEEDMHFRSYQEDLRKIATSGFTYRILSASEASDFSFKSFKFIVRED